MKTLLEWMRLPAPPCRCACHLAEVGVDVKEGYKPPEPTKRDKGVKNRIRRVETLLLLREVRGLRNRWSDAARVASAAARLAKFGAMMGLKPWGDSARASAGASRKSKRSSAWPSSSGGSKARAKKTRNVDISNDVCYACGEKGHWARE